MKALINKTLRPFGYQITRANSIPLSYKILNTYRYFHDKFVRIKDVEGDIVECGVGFGHTLILLLYLAEIEGRERTVWGYDSFVGFPEPTIEDKSIRNPKKGEWNIITPAEIKDIFFRRCQLPTRAEKNLKLIKGFFRETLPNNAVKKIAMLHLDVDLYDSYKVCLEFLYSKVEENGIIMFDEYMQKNTQEVFPGAAKAINEFFADKQEKIQYDDTFDKYYCVKK
jgi:O-methyltransferase